MIDYGDDIDTESDASIEYALANLGRLRPIAGVWDGQMTPTSTRTSANPARSRRLSLSADVWSSSPDEA
jgi:hypothetical protein